MSTTSTTASAVAAQLELTREDAALLLDALRVLGNCHKFAFRDEASEASDALVRNVNQLAARVRAAISMK
ncbi:MAG: hypothetical protein K1X74_07255 [Pirellulales bacterium]|nr:hypothetical protein [Pirellulales bacterium]